MEILVTAKWHEIKLGWMPWVGEQSKQGAGSTDVEPGSVLAEPLSTSGAVSTFFICQPLLGGLNEWMCVVA